MPRNPFIVEALLTRCWPMVYWLYFCWDVVEEASLHGWLWNWLNLQNIQGARYASWSKLAWCLEVIWHEGFFPQIQRNALVAAHKRIERYWNRSATRTRRLGSPPQNISQNGFAPPILRQYGQNKITVYIWGDPILSTLRNGHVPTETTFPVKSITHSLE